MPKWKLAFMASIGFARMSEDEVIRSLKESGYDGVEWTVSHFNPDRPLKELKNLVNKSRNAGLEVSRIMAHEDLVSLDDEKRKERIDKIVRVIHAAGECEVATVGTMTGPAPWDPSAPKIGKEISESIAWEQVFEAYEKFTNTAIEAKTTISSEGVFGTVAHDFYSHKFMMDKLDEKVHKVNFDPSHDILYDNMDVGWVIRQWGDRIGHVHLKDAVGIPDMGKFVFPLLGEGNVNWFDFFAALEDIGYTGYCSVEFESFAYYDRILGADPLTAARISMEQIRKLACSVR